MTLPEPHQIAKAARSLLLTTQCVRSVLRLGNEHQALLSIERQAELEALCVILSRAQIDIARKYPLKPRT